MGLELKEIRECSMLILLFCFLCQCLIINVSYGEDVEYVGSWRNTEIQMFLVRKIAFVIISKLKGIMWCGDGCMQNDHFIDMVYREMLNAHSM